MPGPPALLRRAAAALGVSAVAVALLAGMPSAAGTSWHRVASLVGGLDLRWTASLSVVWFAALLAYSQVLTASLPGLTTGQALRLNLAGSAVSNTVPLGGPVSIGLTTAMARSWGFGPTQIGAFFTTSLVWTAAGRVAGGLLALLGWVLVRPGAAHAGAVVPALGTVALAVAAAVIVLGSERRAAATASAIAGLSARLLRARHGRGRSGSPSADLPATGARLSGFPAGVVRARRISLEVSRRSWWRFTLGMTGYLALLAVLLDGCLSALGHPIPFLVAAVAVGVERLVTAVPITPGGAGFAELGLVTVLPAGGVDPAVAVAAAVLYRFFMFVLEIPVGGAIAVGWVGTDRRRRTAARVEVAA